MAFMDCSNSRSLVALAIEPQIRGTGSSPVTVHGVAQLDRALTLSLAPGLERGSGAFVLEPHTLPIRYERTVSVLVTFSDGCSIEINRDAGDIQPGSVREEAMVADCMAYLIGQIKKHNDSHADTFGYDLKRPQGIVTTKLNKRYGMPPEQTSP